MTFKSQKLSFCVPVLYFILEVTLVGSNPGSTCTASQCAGLSCLPLGSGLESSGEGAQASLPIPKEGIMTEVYPLVGNPVREDPEGVRIQILRL